MAKPVTIKGHHVDEAWLGLVTEAVVEPELPLVDAHHHLFDQPPHRYMFDEMLADVGAGHRVEATVYVEAGAMWRAGGPRALAPIGELEFANGIGAMSASGAYGPARLCAAIVAHADLTLGRAVAPVLDRYLAAAPERFRGIRHYGAHDPDPTVTTIPTPPKPRLYYDPQFREGLAELQPRGLSFDIWVYHPQLEMVADLARAFPGTTMILNHMGGRLGIGPYAGDPAGVTRAWERGLRAIAACPNVQVKIGGFAMRMMGFGFHQRPRPPASDELVAAWSPYVETCIDAFGPGRCIFESNFPVDKSSCSYPVLWNAFKKLTARHTPAERLAMLGGNARCVYRIDSSL